MSVIIIISPTIKSSSTNKIVTIGTLTEEQKKSIIEKLGGTYNANNNQAGTSGTNDAGN